MKIIKWTLFILSIILILFSIWFCWHYDFKGESILIPEGFSGKINIYYERQDGIPANHNKEGRIVYVVPYSGVLRVKFKDYIHRNAPIQNRKYYLYNPKTGKITNEFVEFDSGKYSVKEYLLTDFKYGVDSLAQNGRNFYFDSFVIIARGS